jgi:DNA-binding MarR family transcriptional regulator
MASLVYRGIVILNCNKGNDVNTSFYELFELRIKMQTRAMRSPVAECAREILDTVPIVMRVIRGELRKYGAREMSVPQYRALAFVYRNEGASLSELADHVGLTLSTMSTLVDGLTAQKLVDRREDPEDHRRMTLTLTDLGRSRHEAAREATLVSLGEMLRKLSPSDRATVTRAMQVLRERFTRGNEYAEN